MKILVLGCGPAGLLAVHGAVLAHSGSEDDLHIAVISKKQKSPMYGAQYLHQPIPGVTRSQGRSIRYRLDGGIEAYRRKVYGNMWDGTVSPEDLTGAHMGWDIRETYDALWDRYQGLIADHDIHPSDVNRFMNSNSPDLIINSIPRDRLCYRGHTFGFTNIIAAGDAPDLGIKLQYSCPDETVICNGNDEPSWYRMSRVFGHTTVEWPGELGRVPINSAATVRKPTYHACDCWPDDQVFHVGRYGTWAKGVLSHTAYLSTYEKIKEMLNETTEATA